MVAYGKWSLRGVRLKMKYSKSAIEGKCIYILVEISLNVINFANKRTNIATKQATFKLAAKGRKLVVLGFSRFSWLLYVAFSGLSSFKFIRSS